MTDDDRVLTCGHCLFFSEETFTCRRMPPVIIPPSREGVWPLVTKDTQACGEVLLIADDELMGFEDLAEGYIDATEEPPTGRTN